MRAPRGFPILLLRPDTSSESISSASLSPPPFLILTPSLPPILIPSISLLLPVPAHYVLPYSFVSVLILIFVPILIFAILLLLPPSLLLRPLPSFLRPTTDFQLTMHTQHVQSSFRRNCSGVPMASSTYSASEGIRAGPRPFRHASHADRAPQGAPPTAPVRAPTCGPAPISARPSYGSCPIGSSTSGTCGGARMLARAHSSPVPELTLDISRVQNWFSLRSSQVRLPSAQRKFMSQL